ncbi:MAG: hypothetical protein Fur0037_10360 [Planctomycetota bacterium]
MRPLASGDRTHTLPSTKEPAIRYLAAILVSLLAALALAVSGYGLLLSFRRPPVPLAKSGGPDLPEHPDRVTRLAPLRNAAEASSASRRDAEREIAVELDGAPAGTLPEGSGIAVLCAETRCVLAWIPLASARTETGPLRVRVPNRRLALAFAASQDSAIRGYWSRCDVPDSGPARVDVRVRRAEIDVRRAPLANLGDRAPLILRRIGDEAWRYRDPGDEATTLLPDADDKLRVWLGPGDYALRSLTGGTEFRWTEPAASPIVADLTKN